MYEPVCQWPISEIFAWAICVVLIIAVILDAAIIAKLRGQVDLWHGCHNDARKTIVILRRKLDELERASRTPGNTFRIADGSPWTPPAA